MLYPLWSCPTSAGEDDVIYYWPLRVIVADELKAGHWPSWEPGEATGVPLFADPQSAVFFPPNALFLIAPHKLAYTLCIMLAFAAAGGGAYLYLRRIGLGVLPAIFGALAFQFCGFMVGHRVHLALVQTVAFLPWGLWAIERLRRPAPDSGLQAPGCVFWIALIFALTLAAGHWPTAIQLALVWGVYLLVRARPIGRAILTCAAGVALGAMLVAPQIVATADHLARSVRSSVPYAAASENSFFPLSAVLAFFPFITGCRTPNLFPQEYWGPWHLCEMLGYVGLVTLALAAMAVWRLWRKPRVEPGARNSEPGPENAEPAPHVFVRLWTIFALAAAVWALGYYLPTFYLIHKIPLFGSVRCPARMLLVIDFALATLAAIGLDHLARRGAPRLSSTLRRWVLIYLPTCMAASLGLLAMAYWLFRRFDCWFLLTTPPSGRPPWKLMEQAVRLASPAVFVPIVLLVLTAATVLFFLRQPSRRGWLLVPLLLVDLFFIARFVDVPALDKPWPDPARSPAAEFLRGLAARGEGGNQEGHGQDARATRGRDARDTHGRDAHATFRVWGLGRSYNDRPAELLLPKTCASLGLETISYYGPFQPSAHARLLGFRAWGENHHWEWLIRRNHLLSLFNVRYVLAAQPEFREVLESVRIPEQPAQPDGPNLLTGTWDMTNGQWKGSVLRICKPFLGFLAEATMSLDRAGVTLEEGQVYKVALDARAPQGAGHLVNAGYKTPSLTCLRVDAEQITPRWSHFEYFFTAPLLKDAAFRVMTLSDRPIEIRNITLCRSSWPTPINFGGRLAAGEPVYVDRTPYGLPPIDPADRPVHVYENLLCLPREYKAVPISLGDEHAVVEALRWPAEGVDLTKVVYRGPVFDRCFGPAQPVEYSSVSAPSAQRRGALSANVLGTLPGDSAGAQPPRKVMVAAGVGQVAGLVLLVWAWWCGRRTMARTRRDSLA